MRLDATPIPVCIGCWGLLPVSERLKHAQAFQDRARGGIVEELRVLIASTFANYLEQRGDNWRGRSQN